MAKHFGNAVALAKAYSDGKITFMQWMTATPDVANILLKQADQMDEKLVQMKNHIAELEEKKNRLGGNLIWSDSDERELRKAESELTAYQQKLQAIAAGKAMPKDSWLAEAQGAPKPTLAPVGGKATLAPVGGRAMDPNALQKWKDTADKLSLDIQKSALDPLGQKIAEINAQAAKFLAMPGSDAALVQKWKDVQTLSAKTAQTLSDLSKNPIKDFWQSQAEDMAAVNQRADEMIAHMEKIAEVGKQINLGHTQYDGIVNKYADMYQQQQDIQDKYGKESKLAESTVWSNRIEMAKDSMGMMAEVMMKGNKQQFEAGKALAMATAAVDGAQAIIKALASSAPPMNYVSAGLVGAMVAMQEAQIASQTYGGARAAGGPVSSGSTYLVGELGPELFTPGASGTITPNNKLGGGVTVVQHNTIDARGADAGVQARIDSAMKQAKDEAKAEILNNIHRGGTFARAVGRA